MAQQFKLVNGVRAGGSGHIFVTHGSLTGLAEYDGTTWTLHAGGAQFADKTVVADRDVSHPLA
jgi:hypothetical protein